MTVSNAQQPVADLRVSSCQQGPLLSGLPQNKKRERNSHATN